MLSCTRIRDAAVQASPWLKKPPSTAANNASGSFASSKTSSGFFPPSSISVGVRLFAATRSTAEPVRGDPVNETLPTSRCPASAAPTSPRPGTASTTRSGSTDPISSTIRSTTEGACSGGFSTMALPTASAGATFPAVWMGGQLNGTMPAITPYGSSVVTSSTAP